MLNYFIVGLILLSIFDTRRHPSIHRLFLLVSKNDVVAFIYTILILNLSKKDIYGRRGAFGHFYNSGILHSE
jgi:hypothetical protein